MLPIYEMKDVVLLKNHELDDLSTIRQLILIDIFKTRYGEGKLD